MHESALQTITIGNGVVGVDRAPKLHIAKNFVLQGFAGYIWYDLSANLAKIAVKYSMHNGLVLERAKPISLQATALVHVLSDTADKSFVSFQFVPFAADLGFSKLLALHDFADALQHKPCSRLRDLDRARQFVTADSVLAVGQHPKRNHPLVEGDGRIFHDRLDLYRKLLLAGVAEPDAPSLDKRVLCRSTARTNNVTVRPAQLDRIGKTAVGIGKVHNRFLQRFRLWQDSVHVKDDTTNSHVCKLVYCPR